MKDLTFLKFKFFTHRGIYNNKKIYENSMEAYKLCLKYSFPIECDIRLLKDGTIVCFHDDNALRLLKTDDEIEKLTYRELEFISSYHIPKLTELLSAVNGKVPLLIELKTKKSKKYEFENAVAEILEGYEGEYAIQSFNAKSLKRMKKINKNFILGLLVNKKKNIKKNYDFINIDSNILSDKQVRKLKEDVLVIGYNIFNKEEYEQKKEVYDSLVCDNVLDIFTK